LRLLIHYYLKESIFNKDNDLFLSGKNKGMKSMVSGLEIKVSPISFIVVLILLF